MIIPLQKLLPTFLFRSFDFHFPLLLNLDFLLHFSFYQNLLGNDDLLFCRFLYCPGLNLFNVVSRDVTCFFGGQTPEEKKKKSKIKDTCSRSIFKSNHITGLFQPFYSQDSLVIHLAVCHSSSHEISIGSTNTHVILSLIFFFILITCLLVLMV